MPFCRTIFFQTLTEINFVLYHLVVWDTIIIVLMFVSNVSSAERKTIHLNSWLFDNWLFDSMQCRIKMEWNKQGKYNKVFFTLLSRKFKLHTRPFYYSKVTRIVTIASTGSLIPQLKMVESSLARFAYSCRHVGYAIHSGCSSFVKDLAAYS